MSHNQNNFQQKKKFNVNMNYVKNINNMRSRMTPTISSIEGNSDRILLYSQPSAQPVYPNTMHTMLGAPIIPVIMDEKQMTFTEKNLRIIEEVMREKEKLESLPKNVNEIYLKNKSIIKCDMHPKQLSEKCRKCKEIKIKIEKMIEEENKKINIKDKIIDVKIENTIQTENKEIYINRQEDISENDDIIQQDPKYKVYGDPVTCNLNSLIHNNIISCQYFKEGCLYKNFNEIIEEIIQNVEYAEPWAVGISGVPSTLFCCLYKLMLLKLTESQVNYLINYEESAYIKCTGFLYIRYLTDPRDLWNKLSPYIQDPQIFKPKVDRKFEIKIGKFVENLLTDYDYYGTRLPRIPMPIEREIKANLIRLEESRKSNLIINEIQKEKKYFNRSISRSRSRDRKHKNKKRRSRSRSSDRKRHHKKSRSKSKSQDKNKKLIEKIKEQEREAVLAKGKDYAAKPTSYKSSLSIKLPGAKKRKSRSQSPYDRKYEIVEIKSNNIHIENKKHNNIEYSKEYLERQEHLKKQYSDTTNVSKESFKNKLKPDDATGPDVMRLG